MGQRITNAQHPSRCPEEVGDGRRGELGLLPPARWNLGKNRDGQRRMERRKHTTVCEKRRTVQKKYAARKKRRHRRNRRAARELRVEAKARSRAGELVVGTFNVRTLTFNGKNGIGHSESILKVCQELGCDVVGFQETRRDGQSTFTAAGNNCFLLWGRRQYVREEGDPWCWTSCERVYRGRVEKGGLVVECISARQMKVRIQLEGKSNGAYLSSAMPRL